MTLVRDSSYAVRVSRHQRASMYSVVYSSRIRLLKLFFASVILLLLSGATLFVSFGSQGSTKTQSSSRGKTGRSSQVRHTRTTPIKKHDSPCGTALVRLEKKGDDSTIVKLEVTIDEHGNVVSTNPLSGRKDLRKRADEEARQMKFQPATIKGTPVGQIKTLVFDYTEKEKKQER